MAKPPSQTSLSGIGILVTRPIGQGESLCQKIEALGGIALHYPAIEIQPPANPGAFENIIRGIHHYNIAIFISANAVDRAMHLMPKFPSDIKIAAVGKASAKALHRYGLDTHIVPEGKFNSEALLEHPDLQQIMDKKIVIFRGEGGRELLATTLKGRGAKVDYVECYRRSKPESANHKLMQHWARGEIHLVTVTSNETLSNLYDMVGSVGRHWLQSTPIIGVSHRMLELAKKLGIRSTPMISKTVSDEAIIEAALLWRESQKTTKI